LSSFSLITFGFVIFGAKILYKKRARKTLMKLTAAMKHLFWYHCLKQWFPNFSGARTTKNHLVVREAQNIDF